MGVRLRLRSDGKQHWLEDQDGRTLENVVSWSASEQTYDDMRLTVTVIIPDSQWPPRETKTP